MEQVQNDDQGVLDVIESWLLKTYILTWRVVNEGTFDY